MLTLSDNSLRGPLPSELGLLADLSVLLVQGNRLSGALPPQLAQLDQVQQCGLVRAQVAWASEEDTNAYVCPLPLLPARQYSHSQDFEELPRGGFSAAG